MTEGRRRQLLFGCVSLAAVWVSVGLLLVLWGIGFTVGTMPSPINPEYRRVANVQANIALVLMAAVHGIHAVFFAWTARWGHWLVRFGGALTWSSALMVLLGYLWMLWWPPGWPEPMTILLEWLVRTLARIWDSA